MACKACVRRSGKRQVPARPAICVNFAGVGSKGSYGFHCDFVVTGGKLPELIAPVRARHRNEIVCHRIADVQ